MANSVKTTSDWMSLFLGSSRSGQDKMTVSGLSGSGHLSILQAYRSFYMLEFPFPPLPCPKEPPNLTAHSGGSSTGSGFSVSRYSSYAREAAASPGPERYTRWAVIGGGRVT